MLSRPRIRPPFRFYDWILLALSFAMVLGHGIYLGTLHLPEGTRIPMKFDFAGNPVTWAGASSIWLLWSVSILVVVLMLAVGHFPWTHNYPWKLNSKNAPALYSLSRTLLNFLAFWLVLSFLIINLKCIQVGLQFSTGLDPGFLIAVIAVPLIGLGYYFYRGAQIARDHSEIL
jgi:hypothetical protein